MMERRLDEVVAMLRRAEQHYVSPVFSCSFSKEDMVLLDLITQQAPGIAIVSLDTGRLPEQTYQLMDAVRERYGPCFETWYPDAQALQDFVDANGHDSFYRSVEQRQSCCQVRKVEVLRRALKGRDAWITGLRHSQSVTRKDLPMEQWDRQFRVHKISPLLDWRDDDVESYLHAHSVPVNALYDMGYRSIGCAPCTRAVPPDGKVRDGRWWWEADETKECGLHVIERRPQPA